MDDFSGRHHLPPPPGLNYTDAIRPSLNFILVVTPLGAVLVPLIIALFVSSPPHVRRHPIFILNILACCTGIIEAVINAVLETNQILFPLEQGSKGLLMTVTALAIISPLFIDSILLFRILAFYPFDMTPTSTLAVIFGFPLLVKCGRFTAIVMFLNSFTKGNADLPIFKIATINWQKNPYVIAEWAMQMVDNAYASSIFLYKIWEFHKNRNGAAPIRSRSLLSYLRTLFVIALGNFIFPVIMNIALIVLIATDPSYVDGAFFIISNNYVSILGVVFATIWTQKQNWNQQEDPFKGEHFQRNQICSGNRFGFDAGPDARSLFSIPTFRPVPEIGGRETATHSDLLVN